MKSLIYFVWIVLFLLMGSLFAEQRVVLVEESSADN